MNERPVRPPKRTEIELFARYSDADLLALETNLAHVPEGKLPVMEIAIPEESLRLNDLIHEEEGHSVVVSRRCYP